MQNIHRKYKVKPKDTIEIIAVKNELDIKELIAYHNKRADSYDQIRDKIPPFLQELILPPKGYGLVNGKEVWLNKEEEPETLVVPYIGKLNSEPFKKDLNYGIYKTIKSGTKENTIKYEISVRYYPKNEENNRYVSVDLISKIFINNEEPSLTADELAIACTEILYPLIFRINRNGLLLEIQNHDELLKRWKKHKQTKLKYYQGETANNYIEKFEETLVEKDLLLYYLQNDWFFNIYFNKIYTIYQGANKPILDEVIDFPILPNTKSVAYTIRRKANRVIKNNRIKIELKGKCTDSRNRSELENGSYFPATIQKNKKPVKGNYRSIYFLKPNNHKIQHAYLECNLELNKPKKITISISELNSTINKEDIRHPEYIVEKEEYEEGKKTFWKSIFS